MRTRRRHRGAHALLSAIFVVRGAQAAQNPKPLVEHAERVVGALRSPLGLSLETADAVRANGVVQALAGLGLALDVLPRLCAVALVGSLVPTTLAGHAFWREESPEARQRAETDLMKNLGLLGGLLLVATERTARPRAATA